MIKLECELRKGKELIRKEILGGIKLQAFAEVKTKEGVLLDEKEIKCNSFVKQFPEVLFSFMGCQEYESRRYDDVLVVSYPRGEMLACNAGAGSVVQGIVVGTGTATPTISDYKIQTPIAHGTGAGQLQYAIQDFEAPASPDAVTSYMGLRRAFTNGSGASITIMEVGFYWYNSTPGTFLMARDLIVGGLVVPNGATATITYRIIVTVPGFTRQFINIISRQIRQTSISAVDITNTVRTESASAANLRVVGAGGRGWADSAFSNLTLTNPYQAQSMGIVIGTGITGVDTSDWKLATRIVHGKSAGEILYYGSYCEHLLTVVGNTGTFKIERVFENSSGAGITVREMGLQCRTVGFLFHIARHLVSPEVPVLNGEVLRATYTVSITT